jgi:phosphatidylserine/phosphatidylglycerophosphate/cardiolipin synthase-like enzyme
MPTLAQLRSKWFINIGGGGPAFPPVRRHPGSTLSDYTDGNLVTPHIDGQDYMKTWHESIRAMSGVANVEIYHSAWRLEGVRTLGNSNAASDALETLNDADNDGVEMFVPMSMHLSSIAYNRPSGVWLWLHGITNARMDNRYPIGGSNHFKYACLKHPARPKAIVGSIDISKTRWDTRNHLHKDTERSDKPTHDIGVEIQGPAVGDIERSFVARWNDPTRVLNLLPPSPPPHVFHPPPPLITTPISSPPDVGPHSIQVLETYGITPASIQVIETYGITPALFGYSWSPIGEFTVWASYLNAIRTATNYIYIEDQYFLAWDWPVCHKRTGTVAQDSDIVYQLGEAIKRSVNVIVVTPANSEDPLRLYQKYQKDYAANYLATVASTSPGDFIICYLHNGTSEIYVHSKLMIVDDEFVLLGSANIGQRSMTHDGELHLGIVDDDDAFALNLRSNLWEEHLQIAIPTDPNEAFTLFKDRTINSLGRVRSYPSGPPGPPPRGHPRAITSVIDPYAGPPR